jgi:hypothetical protein
MLELAIRPAEPDDDLVGLTESVLTVRPVNTP